MAAQVVGLWAVVLLTLPSTMTENTQHERRGLFWELHNSLLLQSLFMAVYGCAC
jgi:hypothetical protein